MTSSTFGLPELPTVKQWAEAFQVSPLTVYRAIKKKELKAVKVGNTIRICRDIAFEQIGLVPEDGVANVCTD